MGKLSDYLKMEKEELKKIQKEKKAKKNKKINAIKRDGFDSIFEQTVNDNLQRMKKYYDFDFSHHEDEKNLHWWTYNKYSVRYKKIGISENEIVNDKIHHIYEPDFFIKRSDCKEFFIEAKGHFPATDRTKMLEVRRCNPNVEIKMVFQKKQKIKELGIYNTEWCEKYDFDYSVNGMIKKEWLR